MYLEFAIYPNSDDNELWITCCKILQGKIELPHLDINEFGRESWLYRNMRHSGIDDSIHFMVKNQQHFLKLMSVYDYLKSMDLIKSMQLSNNTITINELQSS